MFKYFNNIMNYSGNCPIGHYELDKSHVRKIITINNGINSTTQEDYPLSYYDTIQIIDWCNSTRIPTDPMTRKVFSPNELKRIKWYEKCLKDVPTFGWKDLDNWRTHIENWMKNPHNIIYKRIVRYFIIYEQIIKYFGFEHIKTRSSAEKYLESKPCKSWVLRKTPTIKDTKYNKYFILTVKNLTGVYCNFLFVHQQGYGICSVDKIKNMKTDKEDLIINHDIYYTNIIDLLTSYLEKLGDIIFPVV